MIRSRVTRTATVTILASIHEAGTVKRIAQSLWAECEVIR